VREGRGGNGSKERASHTAAALGLAKPRAGPVFYSFIHSFISGMHHYDCVVPNVDIILQSGRF